MRYPCVSIGLYLQDKCVLVIGDGKGAKERITRLEAAGATVTHIPKKEYTRSLLRPAFLVMANDDDDDFNTRVVIDAQKIGCPLFYAHDQPKVSHFAMPALIRIGPLSIAISTEGVAPALSRQFRRELNKLLEPVHTKVAMLLDELATLRKQLPKGQRKALTIVASRFRLRGTAEVGPTPDI